MSLESLGIDKRNLRHIEITLPKGTEEDRPLGQDLYILDKNTLLLYRRGVFFRAELVPDSWPMIFDPDFELPSPDGEL